MKKLIRNIPGFRSGKLWKKLLSIPMYIAQVITSIAILTRSNQFTNNATDSLINIVGNVFYWLIFIVIPFSLVLNIRDIRSYLPLFRSKNYLLKAIGWTLIVVLLFVSSTITINITRLMYSDEFVMKENFYNEQQRVMQEEYALLEQQKKAKLSESLETESFEVGQQAVVLSNAQHSTAEINGGGQEQGNDDTKITAALLKKYEKSLKKHNNQDIIQQYETADEKTRTAMESMMQEFYSEMFKSNLKHITGINLEAISKLYTNVKFLNKWSVTKTTNAGVIANALGDLQGDVQQFQEFEKKNPRINYGIVKDRADVEMVNFYLNYNIMNHDGEYTGEYFISSYEWFEYLDYMPTDDWEAILIPSKNEPAKITDEGIYEMYLLRVGSKTLIDFAGFSNEYPVYREVSQKDIGQYNEAVKLQGQKDKLLKQINQNVEKITALTSYE